MSDLPKLPAWLDAGAATLAGAMPPAKTLTAALPGYTRAPSLRPCSACSVCRRRASASALARRADPPRMATIPAWSRPFGARDRCDRVDVRSRGAVAVLDGAPWLLAEGVLIAAGLRDSLKVELRLPAELNGHEVALLNAVDAICSLAQVAVRRRQVVVRRDSRPSCWGEGCDRPVAVGPHTRDLVSHRPAVRGRAGPRCVVVDASPRREAAWPGRAGSVGEPAAPARRLEWRRRDGRPGPGARLRRRPGGLPAALRSGPVMRATVVRVRGHHPRAVQPDGDGHGCLCSQAGAACALSPLAAGGRRRGVRSRSSGACRAPGGRDHSRTRRTRPPRHAR